MPVTVTWLNAPQTIIQLHYEKPWAWADFLEAVAQANRMLDTVHHPVDMVVLMQDGLPRDIGPWRFRVIFRDFHSNVHDTALLGASEFMRQTITAFMRVMGRDTRTFFFAASLDEAYARFAAHDEAQHPTSAVG